MKVRSKTRKAFFRGLLPVVLIFIPVTHVAPQSCVAAPAGIVAWWPGDSDANDVVGENHGVPMNGITFAQGMVDGAFSFDGIDDHVEIPAMGPFGEITVEAWLFANSLSGLKMIRGDVEYGPAGLHYEFSDNQIEFSIATGPDNTFDFVLSTNRWYHVVTTYSDAGDFVRLYVDGDLKPEINTSASAMNLKVAWLGGWAGSANRFFHGLIDEFTIYNRVLDASEIGDLFQAGSAGKCKGVPFAEFTITKAEITFSAQSSVIDSFDVKGEFTLGSDGIDPLNEDVVVTLGTFSVTIPGSFVEHKGKFQFEGAIDGSDVSMEIKDIGADSFGFVVAAVGVDLTGTANPFDIELSIGDDTGATNLRFDGKLTFKTK